MEIQDTAPAPTVPWTSGQDHAVQFYESEEYLCSTVADYIAEGLAKGEPAVVIATRDHREGIGRNLRAKGLEPDGQLTLIDAGEALGTFMAGSTPNAERFNASIGGTIEKAARSGKGSRIRAYGEMVDLLWRDGNAEAAIRLEELWNDLGHLYTFSLLCAYPIGNFYREVDIELFDDVCKRHGRVLPAESYAKAGDEAARELEISRLQQRAAALETEIRHRRELERALREALSARGRAEDALRRNERELKDFVEHAPIGMHWVGPDGTILWANQAELSLLGYSPSQYIGRNIREVHADEPVIDDILTRLLAREAIQDYEARLVAKDGSIRHVAISSNALFDGDRFVHTRCFTRDITDRKRLEHERRRNEEANAFLLDASAALNRSLDYDTRLREIPELIVPRLADWCAVDLAREEGGIERVSAAGSPAMETEERVHRALRTALPDSGDSWMVVPMTINDRVLGTISMARGSGHAYSAGDLTLSIEVARRAAIAVDNARLYQLAQTANRTKDEFLATLSHEIRTPLTAILGWARMLTLGGMDEETTRMALETIERSARTQAAIIDDLLDLSRVVTGKLTLQNDLVDLASVIVSAEQTLRLAAEAKGIRVVIAPVAERHVINGDPTRLQQIVWNLLSNAIKFSDAGAEVSVALDRIGDTARLVVRDTGRGIEPEFLPHVFEAFRQADGASTRMHGGLGLGLAIVKYLTELHGGKVHATSDGEGQGATFVVTLPLVTEYRAARQ